MRKGVFCAVRAEVLQTEQIGSCSQSVEFSEWVGELVSYLVN
jgi:hypothetical protein